ncbi:3-beta hydroxysteroid dehydrogenase/isomerase family-domain-containing protein [Truncatella angustata]|uniref:Sterol-4-alpha-carboxylate 3-dehydrogenase ERG26, decarboxylating n=1 Tax=Truncatella angustata TaxID=152316 RepID=A0A9P8UCN4_9PEZI|nr:3-beta hydroxysteroid dehydrogenase/isomerase family-domain-containing protein [Truncatella angustata]KAH6646445.1 3-beta hydroxysteroid dehydrogenase/isomerase family-domain-containing protein [Truncatella angustata]
MASEKAQKASLGRVLVIGGCGFLGHHVVNVLLRDWTTSAVSVIDLRCQRNRRPENDGVEYVEADITDSDKLTKVFGRLKPDVVIHTASPPAQGSGAVSNDLFYKVNVEGTRAVVTAAQQSGVKALVFTSSASVMSDNKSDLINANENWPVIRGKNQSEYYSETKAEAESIVLAANRAESHPQLLTASIRPSGIFGEGDMQAVFHMVNIYEQGRTNVQVGENTNLFDWTYVENVAHGHLLAAQALLLTAQSRTIPLDHERVDGEAFIITNGQPVYFWDFTRAIWRAAGNDKGTDHVWQMSREVGIVLGLLSEIVFGILRKPPTFNRQRIVYSCMTRYYDISKAKRRLGYKPLVDLSEGVRRAVQWTLDQKKLAKN